MTIAFIASDYPPLLGGISRYTGDVVRFLARAWTVNVYCWTDSEPVRWESHPHTGCISPAELREHPEAVARRLLGEGARHAFINHIDMAGPRTALAFHRAGLPLSVFIYGADINMSRGLRSYARMYVSAARMTHRIVISRGTRAVFRRRLPGLSSQMILPGIHLEESQTARRDAGEGIIAIGRFVRRKGFDTLLDAAALLRDEGLSPPITLVGDGEDRAWLSRRIDELGLSGTTRILSGLSDQHVRDELRRQRVFCLLPRSLGNGDVEGFGIVFLEAAREGLPVVAGRSGGVPDAVSDGRNGFLVDPTDPSDAAHRLRQLLTDDALWKQQSAESKRWYRSFGWENRDPRREFSFLKM